MRYVHGVVKRAESGGEGRQPNRPRAPRTPGGVRGTRPAPSGVPGVDPARAGVLAERVSLGPHAMILARAVPGGRVGAARGGLA
jgi:hypothetical protein